MEIDAYGFGNARYGFARQHTPSPTACFQTEILPYLPAFFSFYRTKKLLHKKIKKVLQLKNERVIIIKQFELGL